MTDVPSRPVRVLQLLADPRSRGDVPVDNPYTALLVDSLPRERVHSTYFRWRGILTDQFDVLHTHWPENSLRHPGLVGRAVKAALFAAFLARLRVQRKAIVRTVHNTQPHEPVGRVQAWMLARLDAMTTLWLVLNETTPTPDPTRTRLVPHGHYRDWYSPPDAGESVGGRLLNFGMIRPYKGTEALLSAFQGVAAESGLTLRVVGASSSPDLARRLTALMRGDSRISMDLRFVRDDELAAEIASAEFIVLPYHTMHNSGAVLLALSLGRPVIIPSADATEMLVDEFGPEWVATYRGRLDADALLDAVRRVRSSPRAPGGPDMSSREWRRLGRLLADAYETAFRLVRSS